MPRRAEPGVAHVTDHAQGPFRPHGQMSVRQVGRVLECEACGPFNVEFMQAFNRMWLAHLGTWAGEQAVVVYTRWTRSLMATPDALAYYDKVMAGARQALPAGTVSLWCVPADVEGRAMMLPRWQAIMAAHGHPLEVVDNDAEGRARVSALLER